jgi:hypothetical protein
LIDLAIENVEDVTRTISFRNIFSEGMACCMELYEQKQRERRYAVWSCMNTSKKSADMLYGVV